ncbi:hypothetical protein GCM10020367_14540 [Streptomyces sannanensis]|uniref:Uncharacterized protein n=1 Tax=Streptomyces sannanensis TaxID=285536 RepID=A0ABP6S7L1_9ACTN
MRLLTAAAHRLRHTPTTRRAAAAWRRLMAHGEGGIRKPRPTRKCPGSGPHQTHCSPRLAGPAADGEAPDQYGPVTGRDDDRTAVQLHRLLCSAKRQCPMAGMS